MNIKLWKVQLTKHRKAKTNGQASTLGHTHNTVRNADGVRMGAE